MLIFINPILIVDMSEEACEPAGMMAVPVNAIRHVEETKGEPDREVKTIVGMADGTMYHCTTLFSNIERQVYPEILSAVEAIETLDESVLEMNKTLDEIGHVLGKLTMVACSVRDQIEHASSVKQMH